MRRLILEELKYMVRNGETGKHTMEEFNEMDDEELFSLFCTYKFDEGRKSNFTWNYPRCATQ
jgi:hypothetical protein